MRAIEIDLPYGRGEMPLRIPDENVLAVLAPHETPILADPLAAVGDSLRAPIGGPPLARIIAEKSPRTAAIVVNDLTRPTPYNVLLPPLLEELRRSGLGDGAIKFFIAGGAHKPQTAAETREIFGSELVQRYAFLPHDPDSNLLDLGPLPSGNSLLVNREAREAELVIATGIIVFHWFAGFSGGRKSILPGLAGRATIERNHRLVLGFAAAETPIDENPVSLEMIEAARRFGVDFILNAVTNERREIVRVVAGDLVKAWRSGVDTCAAIYRREIPRSADLVIASAGGHPKDINLYQAQKALENAARAARDGGVIILLAECGGGLGDPVFCRWMREAAEPVEIIARAQREFVLGAQKALSLARVLAEKRVILVSRLERAVVEAVLCRPAGDLAEALDLAQSMLGSDFQAYVIPQAGLIRPCIA